MALPRLLFVLVCVAALARPALALDAAAVSKLAFGENEEKLEAIAAIVKEGDPRATAVLEAFAGGELQTADKRVLIVRDGQAFDAITGAKLGKPPQGAEDVVANNRLRGAVQGALAALKLGSKDRVQRLAAV